MTTFSDLKKLVVKARMKVGVPIVRDAIQKYAPTINNVVEADYDKLAADLTALLPQRKTEMPAAIAAPYGKQEAETDTTSQQVESLTMKSVNHCIEGICVVDRASAQKLVEVLQKKWDLIDNAAVHESLMEKMEERHGEEFNAFFEATVRQVMLATGLQQVKIDTSAILLSLAQGNPMRVREEPGFLIYELVEDNDANVH